MEHWLIEPEHDGRVYTYTLHFNLVPANGSPCGPVWYLGTQWGIMGEVAVTFRGNSEEGVEVDEIIIDDLVLVPMYPGENTPREIEFTDIEDAARSSIIDQMFEWFTEWAFGSIPAGEMECFGEPQD